MRLFLIDAVIDGRDHRFYVEADDDAEAVTSLSQAWADRLWSVRYRAPGGSTLEVQWRNVASLGITAATPVPHS